MRICWHFPIPITHIVVHLTFDQTTRCFVVDLNVVKRVGDDLARPDQTGLKAHNEKQLYRSEHYRPDTGKQPQHRGRMQQTLLNQLFVEHYRD